MNTPARQSILLSFFARKLWLPDLLRFILFAGAATAGVPSLRAQAEYTADGEPTDRFAAEGYHNWNTVAENISAGHNSAEAVYVAWWKSSGHRRNMCNSALREIGIGYFYRSASPYGHYYTMDLGGSWDGAFFTDTLFSDNNGDCNYDQSEGIRGVRISLRIQGAEHSSFDLSAPAGSFAIPTSSIVAGSSEEVWLTNQNAAAVSLSIPRAYTLTEKLELAAAESRLLGTMLHQGTSNAGFRQLTTTQPAIVPPVLSMVRTANVSFLSWPSQTGLQFLPQWSSDLTSWVDLGGHQYGSGGVMFHSETTAAGTNRRFYRLVIRRP